MLGLDHLNKIKQTNDLVDIWQKKHPDKRWFTFHNNSQQIHSRIDRIYIKNNQKTINRSIIPTALLDDYAVMVTIQIEKTNISCKGYWKLKPSRFSTEKNKKINIELQKLTNNILQKNKKNN